jgi:hypothetical protein
LHGSREAAECQSVPLPSHSADWVARNPTIGSDCTAVGAEGLGVVKSKGRRAVVQAVMANNLLLHRGHIGSTSEHVHFAGEHDPQGAAHFQSWTCHTYPRPSRRGAQCLPRSQALVSVPDLGTKRAVRRKMKMKSSAPMTMWTYEYAYGHCSVSIGLGPSHLRFVWHMRIPSIL